MNKTPILRSGFIGLSMNGLRLPVVTESPLAELVLNKASLLEVGEFFYHEGVNNLFVRSVAESHSKPLSDFDFQEQILLAAKEAFSVPTLEEWVVRQYENSTITNLHSQFLGETINYLAGKNRTMELRTWIKMLQAGKETGFKNSINVTEQRQILTACRNVLGESSIHKVLVRWVKRGSGYQDLLFTLQAIFGNRRILRGY